MRCARAEKLIATHAEAGAKQDRALDRHLSKCSDCAAFRAALLAAESALAQSEPMPVPDGLAQRALARAFGAQVRRTPNFADRFLSVARRGALAAAAVTAVLLLIALLRESVESTAQDTGDVIVEATSWPSDLADPMAMVVEEPR